MESHQFTNFTNDEIRTTITVVSSLKIKVYPSNYRIYNSSNQLFHFLNEFNY